MVSWSNEIVTAFAAAPDTRLYQDERALYSGSDVYKPVIGWVVTSGGAVLALVDHQGKVVPETELPSGDGPRVITVP